MTVAIFVIAVLIIDGAATEVEARITVAAAFIGGATTLCVMLDREYRRRDRLGGRLRR